MTGAELRERRLKLELSQEALAKLLGTKANTIARNERGDSPIQNPVMMDLALQTLERNKEIKKYCADHPGDRSEHVSGR